MMHVGSDIVKFDQWSPHVGGNPNHNFGPKMERLDSESVANVRDRNSMNKNKMDMRVHHNFGGVDPNSEQTLPPSGISGASGVGIEGIDSMAAENGTSYKKALGVIDAFFNAEPEEPNVNVAIRPHIDDGSEDSSDSSDDEAHHQMGVAVINDSEVLSHKGTTTRGNDSDSFSEDSTDIQPQKGIYPISILSIGLFLCLLSIQNVLISTTKIKGKQREEQQRDIKQSIMMKRNMIMFKILNFKCLCHIKHQWQNMMMRYLEMMTLTTKHQEYLDRQRMREWN